MKILDLSRFRVRKLTPTEYGRLQAFPMEDWEQVVSDSQAYKQFGNAVTTTVVTAVAEQIKRALDEGKKGGASMISEYEKENREELFRLMRENPELPVVPMVDSEIVCDDGYARWRGAFGSAHVGQYIISEECIHFRDDTDWGEIEETLTDGQITYEEYEAATEAEAMAIYAALPWIEAIIVDIDLPD